MKEHGPWKIKERVLKYSCPWVKVYEDQVIQPDGKDGIHVFIDLKSGVCVLPLDDEGYIYLTKEFHYGVGEVTTEVVAGGIDEGEPSLEAARRELKEELGITAEEWIDLGKVERLTTYANIRNDLFIARKLNFIEKSLDGTESVQLFKIKFEEAVRMIMESKITNSISCLLILKAWEYLKGEG